MSETIEELQKENAELRRKLDAVEKRNALLEQDGTKRGFYALNKIVNQQANRLYNFDLEAEIKINAKDDKVYDRTNGIWEKFAKMITDLNALKIELKLTGNEEKDNSNIPFIERIAQKRD